MSRYHFNSRTGKFHPVRHKGRQRFYSAGSQEGFVGWDVSDVSANAAWYPQALKVLARSRDLERNNDYVRAFLRLNRVNVIGPKGVKLRSCRTNNRKSPDKTFNDAFEHDYLASGKIRNRPVLEGGMSRVDIGGMWLDRLAVDGEVLLVRRYGTTHNKFGYTRQFIDAAQLDHTLNGSGYPQAEKGNLLKMGIEVNGDGLPIAYHFLTKHPSEHLWQDQERREHVRIEARFVEHTYFRERPGQMRGVPLIAPGAVRARMLDKFEEAIAVGSRVAASKMLFYKPTEEWAGGGEDGDEPGMEDEDIYLRQEVEPGMAERLPRGMEVETFDPNYPPGNLDEFIQAMGRGLAASLGGDYTMMFNDLKGTSFSTLRQAAISQRDIYRALQHFYIEHHLEPDLHAWAEAAMLAGALTADESKARALLEQECYRFQPRGWQWVDPAKDMQANQSALEANLTSEQRLVEELHGEDYEVILEERANFKRAAEKLGLKPFEGKTAAAAKQPQQAELDLEETDD